MSSLGPIQYEEPEGSVFLGRDYTKTKFTSDALSNEIDNEVRKIITSAQKEAKKVILENQKLLELIKTLLLERETIVSEEIEYIAKNMKLPPAEEEEKKIKVNVDIKVDDILNNIEHSKTKKDNKDGNSKTKEIEKPKKEDSDKK